MEIEWDEMKNEYAAITLVIEILEKSMFLLNRYQAKSSQVSNSQQ